MTHPISSVLATMVGPGTLLSEEESGQWRRGQRYSDLPVVVLAPATEEELAAVLTRASEEGWRVLPAGSEGGVWAVPRLYRVHRPRLSEQGWTRATRAHDHAPNHFNTQSPLLGRYFSSSTIVAVLR